MDNENVLHIHNGVLFTCKELYNHDNSKQIDETLPSEITQTQKENHHTCILAWRLVGHRYCRRRNGRKSGEFIWRGRWGRAILRDRE